MSAPARSIDAGLTAATRARRGIRYGDMALVLMLASGFAGLGYQVVWTQQCASWLGHESAGVLAVVAAFFGGCAIGALATGRRIERSARPLLWYASSEAVIAGWGVALHFAMPLFGRWVPDLIGVQPAPAWQWTVSFVATFLLLLPATAAMGATVPAIERVAASLDRPGRSIAAWYAANTGGAVLGVLATAFWLVPTFGLSRTALICSALNLLCCTTSLAALPHRSAVVVRPKPPGMRDRTTLLRLATTGFLGIGYEVVVVRVLSQVAEDTVYTFALLLAVYLAGTAIGAALHRRGSAARAGRDPTDRLSSLLAIACLAGTAGLWGADAIRGSWLGFFGSGLAATIGVEAALAVVAFGLPTIAMGALFSRLCMRASDAGVGFGTALGINALAAAPAPLVFGVVLMPSVGPKLALLAIVAGYLAVVGRSAWRRPLTWIPAVLVAAMAILAPPLAFIDVPDGGSLVSYRDGIMASVGVTEDADGIARLFIDNRQQEGSSATLFVDARQALLPLLLHPAPRRALFLGLGTGMTASSAAEDPSVEVDAVELLPEVIAASRHFTRAFDDGHPNPRLHLIAADARRYVRAASRRYDVIVADNYHPARSGSAALYTVEHFGAIRDRLEDDGLFCQWLPLHQLDLATLRSIVGSFVNVYPHGWAMLASNSLGTPVIGLVARRDDGRFDRAVLHERIVRGDLPRPAAFGIDDEFALLGSFVAGPAALTRFATNAVVNTDDRPIVAYRAPRITYAPTSLPMDRLVDFLGEVGITPDELLVAGSDPTWSARLARYWIARDRFIEAGRGVTPVTDVRAMLSRVGQPLFAVLRTSPDFRPAYDPLLKMATALAQTDTSGARALLEELARLQPSRPEAVQALLALDHRAH